MRIPTRATPGDVEKLVLYLRTKPTGLSVHDARRALGDVLERRKLAAFIEWKLVRRNKRRIGLGKLGWSLARGKSTLKQTMRDILKNDVIYLSALQWMHQLALRFATNLAVSAHWRDHHPESVGTKSKRTMRQQALCFFRVVEAARLGAVTLAHRGSPTQLVLRRAPLTAFIKKAGSVPKPSPATVSQPDIPTSVQSAHDIYPHSSPPVWP
jgi:hypothetical protein